MNSISTKEQQLCADKLRRLLAYDSETGKFVWRHQAKTIGKNRASIGAGCLVSCASDNTAYIRIKIGVFSYCAHRLVYLYMTGNWPQGQVDHINGNGLDNRWANLRDVSSQENRMNKRKMSNNKSGICGVYLRSDTGDYRAEIRLHGRKRHLYNGPDFFEACCARKSAEARLGFHPNHGN